MGSRLFKHNSFLLYYKALKNMNKEYMACFFLPELIRGGRIDFRYLDIAFDLRAVALNYTVVGKVSS